MTSYTLEFPSDRLFARMLRIIQAAGANYGRPFEWTFGGGTVLALRHQHRFSKDIDVFVPDPQYLGYLSPRLIHQHAQMRPGFEAIAASGDRFTLDEARTRVLAFLQGIDLARKTGVD